MYDYFDREHAKELKTKKQILCNNSVCTKQLLKIRDIAHFKNYVEKVHGITLKA